jgi:fructuronate reductase
MTRLSEATLGALSHARTPRYDRRALKTGIVHLGTGAFHRAHQGVFTEDCIEAGDLRWGIRGASLRSAAVGAQLNPQDGLYACMTRDGAASHSRIIGACQGVMVAPENPNALVEAMAHEDVHVVTLTVTEKGYKLDPATGALLSEDQDVINDMAGHAPRTAPGFIVAALALRKLRGLTPFTALSCDNLPENGERLRNAVITLAQGLDWSLAEWITRHAAFPSSMVDRIVPATTEKDVIAFAAHHGVRDEGLVKTEPFNQWVIENQFAGQRPEWERAGAQLTADVRPWELAKLRLLNGAHSAIAYLGGLSGHAYVHEAMADPSIAAFVNCLHDEAAATLHPPQGLNLTTYRAELIARFENSALMHKTRQIAMDGSQKLPQRLLNSIRARLDRNQSIDALALAVAGWMRWQSGRDEKGDFYGVDDPLATTTRAIYDRGGALPDIALDLASIDAIFGEDLPRDTRFTSTVSNALAALHAHGAAATVRTFVAQGVFQ